MILKRLYPSFKRKLFISNSLSMNQGGELPLLYDPSKTIEENAKKLMLHVPLNESSIPLKIPEHLALNFLGYQIASPIGIAACPIMLSGGIAEMAQRGFSVFTYKTIRYKKHLAHPLPNFVPIVCTKPISYDQINTRIIVRNDAQSNFDDGMVAFANSLGNPSFDTEITKADIKKAKTSLRAGQVLIVSIYGDTVDEFCQTALIAASAGADIIEANLSCPNLLTHKSPLYLNHGDVEEVVYALIKMVSSIPIIIKVGVFQDIKLMESVLTVAAQAGIRGISGINTTPMRVIKNDNTPAFGSNRSTAGVSGDPIRPLALDFVKRAAQIIKTNKLDLAIIGVGGITKPQHFQELLDAGATIALSATGIMCNINLAAKYYALLKHT